MTTQAIRSHLEGDSGPTVMMNFLFFLGLYNCLRTEIYTFNINTLTTVVILGSSSTLCTNLHLSIVLHDQETLE